MRPRMSDEMVTSPERGYTTEQYVEHDSSTPDIGFLPIFATQHFRRNIVSAAYYILVGLPCRCAIPKSIYIHSFTVVGMLVHKDYCHSILVITIGFSPRYLKELLKYVLFQETNS